MAEEAAAGLQTRTGEREAARWLDAEDATMRQVLAWAMGHDPEVALRLAVALGWWWFLRGRLAGQCPLLAEVTGYAEPGSDRWCAAQFLLGWAAEFSGDMAGAVEHFTALRDAVAGRPPSAALADALAGRSYALRDLGQFPEAAGDARGALAVAREVGHPLGEVLALLDLALAAAAVGEVGEAVRLARQAGQVPGDIPASIARTCSMYLTEVLTLADDFAAAERVCADGLAASRDAGDLVNQQSLLARMTLLDLRAGRAEDAAAHLREALQLALRTGLWPAVYLDYCGHLCAATGRQAEAVTAWAAWAAHVTHEDWPGDARLRQEPLRTARQVLGPGRARAAEERGAAMGWATAAEYALMLTAPARSSRRRRDRAGEAQRPGTGAGHPGRPGRHQCPDRRPAAHQRPHGRLAPGPDPGQDRVPAPRRPDPAGPDRRPGLGHPGPPLPARAPAFEVTGGSFAPPGARAKRVSDLPPHMPTRASLSGAGRDTADLPGRQAGDGHVHAPARRRTRMRISWLQ